MLAVATETNGMAAEMNIEETETNAEGKEGKKQRFHQIKIPPPRPPMVLETGFSFMQAQYH